MHSPALPHTNIRKSRHQTPTPLLSRPPELTLRAFPPPIRGPWGQLPVVSSAQTYRGFSADRPVVVIAWQLARGRDVTGFLSYLESCTMKSAQWSPGSRLGCLHLEVFCSPSLGRTAFLESSLKLFINYFQRFHGKAQGSVTKSGESFAEMDLELFPLFLQPLGFPCFDSFVALMHKGF